MTKGRYSDSASVSGRNESETLCKAPKTGIAGADPPPVQGEGHSRRMQGNDPSIPATVLPGQWRRHDARGNQRKHGRPRSATDAGQRATREGQARLVGESEKVRSTDEGRLTPGGGKGP